ncbi:MAG TPA: 23S rRNA (uracil(1939)-C(5))-methyltransferase RlmD [Gammaproteobacteria bacterium]|nr:23S rRNA (uracil(1939)-C(5))-methyltransferase RlmD [Gammaproteobacteria bacterium]
MATRRVRARNAPVPAPGTVVEITGLSHEGRGIARLAGKTMFVEDALPGESVRFRLLKRRREYDEAQVTEVLLASPQRVEPRCGHFGICGGCALQHLAPEAQVAAKQQTLLDNLERIGGLKPRTVAAPLLGPVWGYRRRARLSAYREPGGKVLVGFTERHRHRVTDVWHCHVLDPRVGGLIDKLSELLSSFSIPDKIPQVEVAAGDDDVVLVIRVMAPSSDTDRKQLQSFGERHGIRIVLQGEGDSPELTYRLPESDVTISFQPADFIQVNGEMNRRLVKLALDALDPKPDEDVLDLFSGLGNFTLPLARRARSVTGVEGEVGLVARARQNATRNGIANADFELANLFDAKQHGTWAKRQYARILLDPPRAGAREVVAQFPHFDAHRIVYVSCHPATLARDAKMLVEQGWTLARAGILDMFPHTTHVESMAVFERGKA